MKVEKNNEHGDDTLLMRQMLLGFWVIPIKLTYHQSLSSKGILGLFSVLSSRCRPILAQFFFCFSLSTQGMNLAAI